MSELAFLDMNKVRAHYENRVSISKDLCSLISKDDEEKFAELALGISDVAGNYSAAEHSLGPRILSARPASAILRLGKRLMILGDSRRVVETLYQAGIPYLKISVGSEIAMMLRPEIFWVANTRSIWDYFLVEGEFDYERAADLLKTYRSPELSSEMEYRMWKHIYVKMASNIVKLGSLGDKEARRQGVRPGQSRNIWYDAIANELYEKCT